MGTVILNVVIVLGIIIAGGFLIFFLGDLLISIVDPKGEEERIKTRRKDSEKRFAKKVEKLPEEVQEELKDDPEVMAILARANDEEQPAAEEQPVAEVEEYNPEPDIEVNEEETEEQRLAEARAALERRKAEILKRMQEQLAAEPEEEEDEEVEQAVAEAEKEETVEVKETPEEAKLREELEAAKRALEQERARAEALEKQIQEAHEQGTVAVQPVKSREAYLADLAELEARLRDNEKEYKACKREYLPLEKVNRTLANDEKKLRRKEAIVAKQKVILYGVNNYEDIDEEKAKKLAEELDLLDGLKLSVQHCREVMENNKERFPVLEKMYYILKAQNEQLRADILEIQEALKNIEE